MLKRLTELCSLYGVSGCENAVRDYIRQKAAPYADEIRTDSIGNVIVRTRGACAGKSTILLAAHMDEVGMIVTAITDEGFLKFDFVGGVDRRVTLGKRVKVGNGRLPGVIGLKAFHLVDKEEEKTIPKTKELCIDIGAENRAEAELMVSLGDYVAFDSDFRLFGDGFLKARAIDDRIGCAVMLKLNLRASAGGLHLRVHRAGKGWDARRLCGRLFRHAGHRLGAGGDDGGGPAGFPAAQEGMRPGKGCRHPVHGWRDDL
jgi:endoglucanase